MERLIAGLEGSGADVYETSGIHDTPMGGTFMTFK